MRQSSESDDIAKYLLDLGSACGDSDELIDELAELILQLGMAPVRINIVQGALHPEVMIKLFVWRAESGFINTSRTAQFCEANEQMMVHGIVKEISLGNTTLQNPAFIVSPLYAIMQGRHDLIHEPLPQSRNDYRK